MRLKLEAALIALLAFCLCYALASLVHRIINLIFYNWSHM